MWPMIIGGVLGAASGYFGSKSNQPQNLTNQFYNNSQQWSTPYGAAQLPLNQYGALLSQIGGQSGQYFQSPDFAGNVVGPSQLTQQGWQTAQGAVPYYTGGAQQAMQGIPLYGQGAGMMMQGTNPMMQGAGMMQGASRDQRGVLNLANTNYGQLSTAADVANNPWVKNQLGANQQNVTQALSEQWLPQLQQQSAGGNAMGSSRQGIAQSQGIERAAQQLANTNASTMLNAYGQGLGAQTSALGMTNAMLGAQRAPAETMFAGGQMMGQAGQQAVQAGQAYGQAAQQAGLAGNLQMQGANTQAGIGRNQEAYQQQLLDEQRRAWEYKDMDPYRRAQMLGQGLGVFAPYASRYSTGTGQSSGTNPNYQQQNPWAAALGGAMAGASFGSGFGGGGGGGFGGGGWAPFNSGYRMPNYSNPMYW